MQTFKAERRAPFAQHPRVGEHGSRTQQRLVDAALEVFASRGYDTTMVKHIADAAGCSRPTFYQYFASKEDLFRKVAGRVAVDMSALIERLDPVDASASGCAALERWLAAQLAYSSAHPVVFTTFSSAARSDASLRSGAAAVADRFGLGLVRRVVDPPPLWDRGHAVATMSMVVRAQMLHGRSGLDLDDAGFTASLARLVHRCVFGPIDEINVVAAQPGRIAQRRPALPALPAELGRHPSLATAGRAAFAELGRHATRVDDIVGRAGLSHGTFYRYFQNKDELFGLLLDTAVAELSSLAGRFPIAGGSGERREWVEQWYGAFADHGSVLAAWADADPSDPFVAGRSHLVAAPILLGLRDQLMQRGVGDAGSDAIGLLALMQRMVHLVVEMGHFDRSGAIDVVSDLVERAFVVQPRPVAAFSVGDMSVR